MTWLIWFLAALCVLTVVMIIGFAVSERPRRPDPRPVSTLATLMARLRARQRNGRHHAGIAPGSLGQRDQEATRTGEFQMLDGDTGRVDPRRYQTVRPVVLPKREAR